MYRRTEVVRGRPPHRSVATTAPRARNATRRLPAPARLAAAGRPVTMAAPVMQTRATEDSATGIAPTTCRRPFRERQTPVVTAQATRAEATAEGRQLAALITFNQQ
jgi:hypothetical protein